MQIKLGDREYEIKYPFAACREMERASGRSITTFASETIVRASSGDVSFDDITLLVWGGILHSLLPVNPPGPLSSGASRPP